MPDRSRTEEILSELDRLSRAAGSVEDFMWEVVRLVHDSMPPYHWVGFYMLEKSPVSHPPVLVLGPFQGPMTAHTRIPVNTGIRGVAASTGQAGILEDV